VDLAVGTKRQAEIFLAVQGGTCEESSQADGVRYALFGRKVVEELGAMKHKVCEHDGRELGIGYGVEKGTDSLLNCADTSLSIRHMFIGSDEVDFGTIG
jgi:hypothetical protein